MNKTILLFFAIIVGIISNAQAQADSIQSTEDNKQSTEEYKTLFSSDKITHGGYGVILMNYSQIDGKDAFLVGMRGMWLINHGVGIGIGGYGFANDLQYENHSGSSPTDYSLAGGYGGLVIEPIIGAKHPVHVSLPILIGAGGVAYISDNWNTYPQSPQYEYNYYAEDATAYFVIEPGVELEFNMVKFFRIGLGAYYRYTSNVSLNAWNRNTKSYENISPDLKGFSFGLSLKFGKF